MNSSLLTLIIPTYNRSACLRFLLDALTSELHGLEGQVSIIIGDNASTDETPALTQAFAEIWSDTLILRHDSNLGPDENFCRCVERVDSPYFWIMGDDDMPRAGALSALLPLLEAERPDLVYLNNQWSDVLPEISQHKKLASPLNALRMQRTTFARQIHVWTTFISGCIVKRAAIANTDVRRFTGTNLVQLGWTMEALCRGQRFIHVLDTAVYATAGNTGGYKVLKVFGHHFQTITRHIFSQDDPSRRVGEGIINRSSIAFLPSLVWGHRKALLGRFDEKESVTSAFEPQLKSSWAYRLVIYPIATFPDKLAHLVFRCSQVLAMAMRSHDRLMARLTRSSVAIKARDR